MWCSMRKGRTKGSHKARTKWCCAYCGAPSENEAGSCTVTVQYGHEDEMCTVCQAQYFSQGNSISVIKALTMYDNVREEDASSREVGSHRRVYGGLWRHTLEELAEFWKAWSKCDRQIGHLSSFRFNM